jgi:hypothetical protein
MTIALIREVWDMMLESTHDSDRDDLAENLVNMLVDADYSSEEIRAEFRGDKLVTTALKYYDDSIEPEQDYEDYEEDEVEDYDDFEDEDY